MFWYHWMLSDYFFSTWIYFAITTTHQNRFLLLTEADKILEVYSWVRGCMWFDVFRLLRVDSVWHGPAHCTHCEALWEHQVLSNRIRGSPRVRTQHFECKHLLLFSVKLLLVINSAFRPILYTLTILSVLLNQPSQRMQFWKLLGTTLQGYEMWRSSFVNVNRSAYRY